MNTKSFRDMKCLLWVILIIVGVTACSKKVPLDKKQFTSLLIDMHTVSYTHLTLPTNREV